MHRILTGSFWLRFTVLFIVAIVPLLLFAYLLSTPTGLAERAQQNANELDRLIQLRQQQVFTIAAFPSLRAFAASTPETRSQRAAVALSELQAWVAADTNVREVVITDPQGLVIMATREGWNSDMSARKFVQDALSGQLAVSPVARDRGEFSNYYAAPILDNSGEIAGALVARVAAQELWGATPRGDNWYAVVSDERGVRLEDTDDPARRLASFAPLANDSATEIVGEQTYGAELSLPRSTDLKRAQDLIEQGALDQLTAADFGADAIGAQRLVTVPWTVLILGARSPIPQLGVELALPMLAALILAFGGAILVGRL